MIILNKDLCLFFVLLICYNIFGDNNMNELFDMLEKNQKNNVVSTIYKIDKVGIKKAHVNKSLKFNNKKIIAFGLGSIMITSGFSTLIKNENKNNTILNSEMTSVITQTDNLNNQFDQIQENLDKGLSFKKANFEVGQDEDVKCIENFMQTYRYGVIEKYSLQYGVDSQIMAVIALQESSLDHEACLPGGAKYNNSAIGMMQLEQSSDNGVYNGEIITAYNYETGEYDQINYTLENVKNYETNIQIACMKFQKSIEKYHGNLYLAIQSHNYGTGMMDSILSKTATKKNIDVETMIEHPFDIDWTNHLENAHKHPLDYISAWKEDCTFGTADYIYSVINCCPNEEANFIYDGKEISFDLRTGHMHEKHKTK